MDHFVRLYFPGMVQIIQFVNSVFGSNTYLIKNDYSKSCYIIDCGDTEPVIKFLLKNELDLRGIFVTHTHYDHIYGLNRLCEEFPYLTIYVSAYGKEGLYSDKLNLSRYHSEQFVLQTNNVMVLQSGQSLKLFDNEILNVYETPGHDWSSLCYKVGNAFFTGDSYLPQYSLVTNFPKSNKEQALDSLEWIKVLSIGCNIYPGHGDIVYV